MRITKEDIGRLETSDVSSKTQSFCESDNGAVQPATESHFKMLSLSCFEDKPEVDVSAMLNKTVTW